MEKHTCALHWSKLISGLGLSSSKPFALDLAQQLPHCTFSRTEKPGETVPVEKEVGIVYILVYTVYTQLHMPQLSLVPAGEVAHHLCSVSIVVQKQNPNTVCFFHFMGHWIKELCNVLSNVQYLNIFYLSSQVMFFVTHSVSPNSLKSL